MHEQTKINEAIYFLGQMTLLVNDRAAFNFNLSALLAAARSALQYANKEARSRPGGQAWYKKQVAEKHIVKYFKDKRDISIHEAPVSPAARIGVSITETLHLGESVCVTIRRRDGTIEEERPLSSSPTMSMPAETESIGTINTHEYFFSDWSGSENVLHLCQKYITEIEATVLDGMVNGFLTSTENANKISST